MYTSVLYQFFTPLALTVLIVASINLGFAQVRSSSNYQIQSDSINIGGGFSSSSNYIQESTVGEVATGIGTSSSFNLYAGYQQMQETYIALSAPSDITLSPTIPGIGGGESNGSTTVTVTTDSTSGYALSIEAELDPSMWHTAGLDVFDDHNNNETPLYNFLYSANTAVFGYTPEGVDIVQNFKNSGAVCNTGSDDDVLACWGGLQTTPRTISSASAGNHPTGATTTVRFRAGVGVDVVLAEGDYIATSTLTAISL